MDRIAEIDRLTYIIYRRGVGFSQAVIAARAAVEYFEEKNTLKDTRKVINLLKGNDED